MTWFQLRVVCYISLRYYYKLLCCIFVVYKYVLHMPLNERMLGHSAANMANILHFLPFSHEFSPMPTCAQPQIQENKISGVRPSPRDD